MPNYAYPTSAELTQIDPILLAQSIADDPILKPGGLFPLRNTDADMLVWEQRDNYLGLTQFRGLNNDPPRVKRVGAKRYKLEPGYYGEFNEVDEAEMTRRASPATWNVPIGVDDLVADCQDQLMTRQTNRMRWICWTLLTTGTFVVLDHDGGIGAQDSYVQQIFTATVPWATVATATPLADLRQPPVLGVGQSVGFGAGGEAWMNRTTFNYLVSNQNANDLRGEKLDGGRTIQSLADVNIVLGRNDLPSIMIFDDGYFTDAGVWTRFIPNNVVVVIGKRSNGATIGEFRLTKNMSAPGGVGIANKVITRGMKDDDPPPAKIEVHRLFHGGPVIYYPGAVYVLNV